jgi:hypothetical protein
LVDREKVKVFAVAGVDGECRESDRDIPTELRVNPVVSRGS